MAELDDMREEASILRACLSVKGDAVFDAEIEKCQTALLVAMGVAK
jgi:hypothetical protein